jgi:V/A-type H+-transporting ATPase subunit D
MSFGQNVTATKIELFKYKRSSQVATMVQKILDDKRKVLLKNIEEMIAEAQKNQRWNLGTFTRYLPIS